MMKTTLLSMATAVILLSSISAQAQQTPCVDGLAGIYPCEQMNLMSFTPISQMGSSAGLNDIWGWVDPETNREYALVGQLDGTSFVDITIPEAPQLIGFLPTQTQSSTWRDIKVFNDHAFIVSEAPGHGMQVFDLTRLRDAGVEVEEYLPDAHYDGFGNSHNIAINEESGYAYPIGTSLFSGGPHFIDISDPLNPSLAGSFSDEGYSHDAQIVDYAGPDEDYSGAEIYFGFHGNNADGLVIVDVSEKSDPQFISRTGYDCQDYTHQGWVTEDHRFCLINDELDENSFGYNTRTRIFDISDLDAPQLIGNYNFNVASTDHNLYIHEGRAYLSNYTSGLRVLDVSRLDEGIVEEVAYFDVHPESDIAGFGGTWSNYPYFPSGNIPVTHRTTGLFVVQAFGLDDINAQAPIDTELCPDAMTTVEFDRVLLEVAPNPTLGIVQINIPEGLGQQDLLVFDQVGRRVVQMQVNQSGQVNVDLSHLNVGLYTLQLGDGKHFARLSIDR